MENASKAILIAGAVIVVLLIISLSVYFYNKSIGVVDIFGNKINTTEVKNHNNSFMIYDGELLGVEVVNACIKIKEYNTNARLPVEVSVWVTRGATYSFNYKDITNYETILNRVNRTMVYNGTVSFDEQGVINKVVFEPK